MKKIISLACFFLPVLLCAGNSPKAIHTAIDPANTYVFICGVLEWKSPSLSSFSNKNRKDEELYNLLLSKGIKKGNSVFLKDNQATLDNINRRLDEILKKTNAQSTFIFYYAGHGVRAGNGPVCFANYDYASGNGFSVSQISATVNSYFKGKQVWLLADCCYSGTLIEEGRKISSNRTSVVTFTSSSSSNISTGNWTFTQTMIDCLSGLATSDRNADGIISLNEAKAELFDAMKYREKQLSGTVFYNVDESATFNLSAVKPGNKNVKVEYIYVSQNSKFEPARVISYNGAMVSAELYRYSDKVIVTVPVAQTKPIAAAQYPVGLKMQVEWNAKMYPAVVKEIRDGFHYIQYTGYDESWNEWVMYNRIYTSDRKSCKIEWQGQWYSGEMLQQKNGKYFVHYTGFGNDWDEWVEATRIKL
ncbi:MAG: caspase family protein [Bacteroidota bacterium]|nr:caspase family protein [Bacteroidota bacterium]